VKRCSCIIALVLLASACQENARKHEYKKVRATFDKACQDGNIKQCAYLGWLFHSVRLYDRKAKTDDAIPMFRYACTKGNAAGCLGAKRITAARKLWHTACAKDDLQACVELIAITPDMTERQNAVAMLDKHCKTDKASGAACGELANVLHKQDKPRWLQLERTACSRGYQPSCSRLASRLYRGDKVAADEAQAKKLWETSCNAGYTPSCAELSLYYIIAHNRKKSDELIKRATVVWKKGCRAGKHVECDMHLRWLAHPTLRKRCLAGDPAACADLMTRVRPFDNERERLDVTRRH